MMKFITEEYLRDLFRKKPFNTYELQQGQRFTPGAVQYLSDKRIELIDSASKSNKNVSQKNQDTEVKQVGNSNLNLKKKLCSKLRSVEAIFLLTSSEILVEDIILAQNITNLGRKISKIRNTVEKKGQIEFINTENSDEVNTINSTIEVTNYVEITEFHMQLKNSCSILKMNTLRCTLVELEFEIIEAYQNDDENLKNRIISNVNSIINSLSRLIVIAVGGKECQIRN